VHAGLARVSRVEQPLQGEPAVLVMVAGSRPRVGAAEVFGDALCGDLKYPGQHADLGCGVIPGHPIHLDERGVHDRLDVLGPGQCAAGPVADGLVQTGVQDLECGPVADPDAPDQLDEICGLMGGNGNRHRWTPEQARAFGRRGPGRLTIVVGDNRMSPARICGRDGRPITRPCLLRGPRYGDGIGGALTFPLPWIPAVPVVMGAAIVDTAGGLSWIVAGWLLSGDDRRSMVFRPLIRS